METVSDVMGPDNRVTFISLGWAGRYETAEQTATRLAASLPALNRVDDAVWYLIADRPQPILDAVPETPEALTAIVASHIDREDWSDTGAWANTNFGLRTDAGQMSPDLALLTAAAGTDLDGPNVVTIRLAPDYPLGAPSQAARLFVDLVRIWQPDRARLSTLSTDEHIITTRAAYLAWTSAKAYREPDPLPEEISIPFGDGTLYASRTWSVEAVTALHAALKSAGAPRYLDRPDEQDPPAFPDGFPAGLEELDSQITWGRHLDTPRV